LAAVYDEYPRQFWLLIGATFIDMVGNALIFPFFALYMTAHFDVGMTQVGVVFAIFSFTGIAGSTAGGALADKLGRKPVFIFALITSGIGNLGLILAPSFVWIYPLAVVLGIVGSVGGPAGQAMVADLLPEEKRAEGFGLFRIVFNLAVTFGPVIGGLLAGVSYALIFILDSLTSVVTAVILALYLHETQSEAAKATAAQETMAQSFRGYGRALRDVPFVAFTLIGLLVWLVYVQMNSTLGVYLRDFHGIREEFYGLIITINAAMVVVMQYSITRWLRRRGHPPMLVLAAGTLLYAIGFGMYGFVSVYALFVLAMAIITVGEMLISPIGQAVAAQFAPEDMRGRYMAVYGFGSSLAFGLGTFFAGLIIDHGNANWVWYLSGIIGTCGALGYVALHRYMTAAERAPDLTPADVPAT
jgi:MFS family permease